MVEPGFIVPASISSRCTFPTSGPVTCAVSGGADSLAMLVLAVAAGLDVTAAHVDHGIRPGSAVEAEAVRAAATRLGARFVAFAVEVPDGPDLEARARRARHGVLPEGTLFGHTADDQAETVLLAVLRGSGLDGLSGMGPDRHPILRLRRRETEAVCAAAGLTPFEDPSNRDPRFRRNRVRHELLPLLDDIAERDSVPLLCRLADLARDDASVLDGLASTIDPTDATALVEVPGPLARRAVRGWLRTVSEAGHPPDAAAVDRVLAVAAGRAVGTEIVGGVTIRRTRGRLRIEQGSGRAGQGR